jgi:hypothetical protein
MDKYFICPVTSQPFVNPLINIDGLTCSDIGFDGYNGTLYENKIIKEICDDYKNINNYICPLSGELFKFPVVAANGITYEFRYIMRFNQSNFIGCKSINYMVVTEPKIRNILLENIMIALGYSPQLNISEPIYLIGKYNLINSIFFCKKINYRIFESGVISNYYTNIIVMSHIISNYVEKVNSYGKKLLHYVMNYCSEPIIMTCIKLKYSTINLIDNNNAPPYYYLLSNPNISDNIIWKFFNSNNINIQINNNKQVKYPIILILKNRIHLLIDFIKCGARLDFYTSGLMKIIHKIVHYVCTKKCDESIVKYIIDNNLCADHSDLIGRKIIHYIFIHGSDNMVYYLLSKKKNINYCDNDGSWPIFLLFNRPNYKLLSMAFELLENKNITDKHNNNLLHYYGDKITEYNSIVVDFIEAGIKLNKINDNGIMAVTSILKIKNIPNYLLFVIARKNIVIPKVIFCNISIENNNIVRSILDTMINYNRLYVDNNNVYHYMFENLNKFTSDDLNYVIEKSNPDMLFQTNKYGVTPIELLIQNLSSDSNIIDIIQRYPLQVEHVKNIIINSIIVNNILSVSDKCKIIKLI